MYIKSSAEHNAMQSAQPQERRGIARRHLIYYLRTWDKASNRLLGHVVDINTNGFMLISEEPIAVGSEYQLEVRLPNPQGTLQAIRFKAVAGATMTSTSHSSTPVSRFWKRTRIRSA